nr:MAG TPA: NTP-PPase-like protein [Caudoviricetes sp.]
MNTLENVKQWFIDRDLENGGRLDKQSLKLSEEFGELCAGYLKKNEKVTKDSIGDCAVVIVGLALLVKADVHKIFDEVFSDEYYVIECMVFLNRVISKALGYAFDECFELAYQEIKDRKGRWIDGSFVKEEDLLDDSKI